VPHRLTVAVRVIPKSKIDRVDGVRAGRLLLRVAAAPESGAANRSAQALLAAALGVRTVELRLEQGTTSRDKLFSIPTYARDALAQLLGSGSAAGGTAAGHAREARVPRGPVRPRERSRTGRVR